MKWAAAGGASEAVCALFAPPTAEANATAAHAAISNRAVAVQDRDSHCCVVLCGLVKFLFDRKISSELFYREETFAMLDHTTQQ